MTVASIGSTTPALPHPTSLTSDTEHVKNVRHDTSRQYSCATSLQDVASCNEWQFYNNNKTTMGDLWRNYHKNMKIVKQKCKNLLHCVFIVSTVLLKQTDHCRTKLVATSDDETYIFQVYGLQCSVFSGLSQRASLIVLCTLITVQWIQDVIFISAGRKVIIPLIFPLCGVPFYLIDVIHDMATHDPSMVQGQRVNQTFNSASFTCSCIKQHDVLFSVFIITT